MKALKIAGAVVAVLVAGIVIVLMTFNVDQYKGVIETQAKAATGRTVTIGDIDLAVSLAPAIVLTDVKLANASWGSRPDMVVLPRVEVHTQLVPLLFGTVNLTEISAENPDILLEIDKQGRGNWQFDVASEGSSTPLNVSDVTVSGLKLGYRDAQTGRSADVTAKSIAVEIAGALQDMNIESLETRDAQAAFKHADAAGKVTIGAFDMKARGKIADLGITSLDARNTTLAYKSTGAPLDVAVDALTMGEDGKVDFAGKVSGQDVKLKGTLAPIAVLVAMNKAFPAKVEMEGFGLKATSDLTVEIVKGRPSAKGTVVIPEIDLSKFGGGAPPQKGDGRLFSAEPLPWDAIGAADSDVTLSIGKLTMTNGLVLTNVSLPVKASGARLTMAPVSMAVAGGTISADVGLNAGDKSVALKAEGKGFTAEGLAKALNKGDVVTQGPIDLTMDVRGVGNSVRDVMASLDGSVIAGMGEARLRNDALNMIGADVIMQVLNAINPVGNKDPYTLARCGVLNLQIADGVAQTNQGIALVTDKMQITSSGQIDLRTERLDLNVRPRATGGLGVGLGTLVQAVKVTGPLSEPGVGIDKAGAARTLGALGAAFATGGASLFAQGAKDRVDGGGDPCQTARTWHVKR